MVFKSAGGLSSREIPQTKGLVPGTRQSEVAIRRQDNIRNKVRVTIQTFLGNTKVVLLTGQFPDNQGLVCKSIKRSV